MSLYVQIKSFEGPLPLLLHLIKREDMNIFDINIHEITKQYLDHIKAMKQLDLEVAGEFIAMAATLIHIKSRMLLPQYDENGEEIEAEDPRHDLVQRLLEYQRFQLASENLYMRSLVGRDTWLRGTKMVFESSKVDEEIVLEEDNALFVLIRTYRGCLKNMEKSVHKISGELLSIGDCILGLKDRMVVGQPTPLSGLIDRGGDRENKVNQILVTFLSMLELAKMGFVSLFQSGNFEEIYVHTHRVVDHSVIDQVENYTLVGRADLDQVVGDEYGG